MDELVLRYERDDDPNACGPLIVIVGSKGFSGRCDHAYVSEEWLADLGRRLRAYPLPEAGVREDLTIGGDEGFAISALPENSRGHIALSIKVFGDDDHRVEVKMITDYAALDQFGRALVAVANKGGGEARL